MTNIKEHLIKRERDSYGRLVYPLTHVAAVIDDEGNSLEETLNSFKNNGNNDSPSESPVITTSDIIKITYSNLVELRDNEELIPGKWYRIIDFNTITGQIYTIAAGHQFDILVQAIDVNRLSEIAKATWHEGDDYFADQNLAAWELKYCLDNDTNRFSWAVPNDKKVLYRTNLAKYPDNPDLNEYFEFDGTVEIDGETYYKWRKFNKQSGYVEVSTDFGDNGGLYMITKLDDYSNANIDNPIYPEGFIVIDDLDVASYKSTNENKQDVAIVLQEVIHATGVIYYMKDEHNNEAGYDFKNIMFARFYDAPYNMGSRPAVSLSFIENAPKELDVTDEINPLYFYTFSCIGTNNGKIPITYDDTSHFEDATIGKFVTQNQGNITQSTGDYNMDDYIPHNNKIATHYILLTIDDDTVKRVQTLPDIVFAQMYIDSFNGNTSYNIIGEYAFSLTFNLKSCVNNNFGGFLYNCVFFDTVGNNTFRGVCHQNTFIGPVEYNIFDGMFINNITNEFSGNFICPSSTFTDNYLTYFEGNHIKGEVVSNHLKTCKRNNFAGRFVDNTVNVEFSENILLGDTYSFIFDSTASPHIIIGITFNFPSRFSDKIKAADKNLTLDMNTELNYVGCDINGELQFLDSTRRSVV